MIAAIVILLAALLGGGHIEGAPAWSASSPTVTQSRPTGTIGSSLIAGPATWYPASGNVAAAGPALRQWLGPKWRGTLISVGTGNGTSRTTVRVRLSDWCACGHGRLIDLSDDAFAQLAPLSKGIIGVEVTRVVHVALPATDTK